MSSTPLLRIFDASLNRAGEGLRAAEDYVRFALDDVHLTGLVKSLRHDLTEAASAIPAAERLAARDTLGDVGTEISTDAEARRADGWTVAMASLKRTQQSLRSLEEYGKLVDPQLARRFESIRYRVYTVEKMIGVTCHSRERLQRMRLCVLVDGGGSAGKFERLAATLVEAGVDMIQLRDKRLDDRELTDRARRLKAVTRESTTLAIVNDRPDVAQLAGADGVHLGQEDVTVKEAREIVSPQMLVGVSTHHMDQARAAVADGANYLGAGPTFRSATKEFDAYAGLDYLRELAAEITLPALAIGGINATNLPDVLATGISRVAVGAAVVGAVDPAVAARTLSSMLNATSVAPPT